MCQASRTKSCGVFAADLDQRLRLAGDPNHRAVVQHEAVAVAQRSGLGKSSMNTVPPSPVITTTAAMAIVGIEHDAVDGARAVPRPRHP